MAAGDNEAKLDEMERDNLEKVISEVERRLVASPPDARGVLESFLRNAKCRVVVLDKKIKEAETAKLSQSREAVAVVCLAQKESGLSAGEKEIYSGFLKEDFFTKKDFGRLEQFYARTWDRLSEGGKNEMSQRVWEGIRRDEYRFTELPKVVQEKEAERAFRQLTDSSITTISAGRISQTDRNDFINAYAGGRRDEALHTLDRRSFRENMFIEESRPIQHSDASKGKGADRSAIAQTASIQAAKEENSKPRSEGVTMRDLNLASVNLSGLELDGKSPQRAATEIPRGSDLRSRDR